MTTIEVTIEAVVRQPPWRQWAECRGKGAVFFADDEFTQRVALSICSRCGVLEQCRAELVVDEADREPYGVRGGMTASQRRS